MNQWRDAGAHDASLASMNRIAPPAASVPNPAIRTFFRYQSNPRPVSERNVRKIPATSINHAHDRLRQLAGIP